MNEYRVVKFTVMAYFQGKMVPTEIEFRYEDKGDGIEPKALYISGDLFTISSACNRVRNANDRVRELLVRWVLAFPSQVRWHSGLARCAASRLGEGAVNRPHGRGGLVTTLAEHEAQRAEREHADYCDSTHCYCEF